MTLNSLSSCLDLLRFYVIGTLLQAGIEENSQKYLQGERNNIMMDMLTKGFLEILQAAVLAFSTFCPPRAAFQVMI